MEEKWRELREIEAQRGDITAKLQRIEQKKSTVSVEVYGKVKKDYEDKLKNIDEKMAQYVDLVRKELSSLMQEEGEIIQQEKEIKFRMEESELRYSIGEYDEKSFKKMSDENNKNLDAIKTKLQTLRERKKWLEDFVELKSIEETIEEAIEGAIEPVNETAEQEKPKPEIEIEEHILEEKVPEEEAKLDELLAEEEVVKPELSEEQKAPSEPTAEPSKGKEEVGEKVPCPKCGHLNAADSWYCEKCGAEILDTPQSQ